MQRLAGIRDELDVRMRALAVGGAITLEATRPGTRLVVRLPLR